MDKRQISWLIVRAFGLYLLVQAFILLPELLAGLLAARYYSSAMSTPGSGGGNSFTRVTTSMYRTFAVAPMIRIVLYSAAGIYMIRGGRFLVQLLERAPDNSTDVRTQTPTSRG
jgi:hypothetical protein